jgi:SET family sugar efflux transporter-like MFS transporter
MIGFGGLSTRFPLRRLLIVGAVCGLGYMGLAAVATSTWQLGVGQILNAASIAATSGLGITYMQDLLPRHAGRASTLFSNTFAGGAVLAGPVLGAAQQFGYRMPYVVGAVLSAVALVLLVAVRPATSSSRIRP